MVAGDILAEALKLEPRARAALAQQLLESLEDLSKVEARELWVAEAARRDRAIDAGDLHSVPAEQVFSRLRSSLR